MNPTNEALIERIKKQNDIEKLREVAVKLVGLVGLLEQSNNSYKQIALSMQETLHQTATIVIEICQFIESSSIEMPEHIKDLFNKFGELDVHIDN